LEEKKMRGFNKAIIMGNLGKDPEVRYTTGGTPVARFSVATTDTWTNKQTNNKEQRTDWHNIVVWGKMAEICGEYLKKGRPVLLEGRIQSRSYDDKEGNKKYITEIVASSVQFLGGRNDGAGAGPSTDKSGTQDFDAAMPPVEESAGSFESEDDIPF